MSQLHIYVTMQKTDVKISVAPPTKRFQQLNNTLLFQLVVCLFALLSHYRSFEGIVLISVDIGFTFIQLFSRVLSAKFTSVKKSKKGRESEKDFLTVPDVYLKG